jgi:hypothetical protein
MVPDKKHGKYAEHVKNVVPFEIVIPVLLSKRMKEEYQKQYEQQENQTVSNRDGSPVVGCHQEIQ